MFSLRKKQLLFPCPPPPSNPLNHELLARIAHSRKTHFYWMKEDNIVSILAQIYKFLAYMPAFKIFQFVKSLCDKCKQMSSHTLHTENKTFCFASKHYSSSYFSLHCFGLNSYVKATFITMTVYYSYWDVSQF